MTTNSRVTIAPDSGVPLWRGNAERIDAGRSARALSPRRSHATWRPADDRTDVVTTLEEQAESRVRSLIPLRYQRMLSSPFAFYRGGAAIMAGDLAALPDSGIRTQLCGDAHLANFGLFKTPERSLIFDLNDFDETARGPFEWDVKRLAASFEIATRHRGFRDADRRATVLAVGGAYRSAIRRAARGRVLDSWYERLDVGEMRALLREAAASGAAKRTQVRRTESTIASANEHDSARAFSKLVREVDGRLRFVSTPPLIVPIEELPPDEGGFGDGDLIDDRAAIPGLLSGYQSTLLDRPHPLREFSYHHLARKVVGVGSVGTRAWVILLQGTDAGDPLLLQAKQAQRSVLERGTDAPEYDNHGERVVRGQRLMQAASDSFLGWQRVDRTDGTSRDYYVRQLSDGKASFDMERAQPAGALIYARLCGETLARAHARAGARLEISAYLGARDVFDQAVAEFAEHYADQNDADYESVRAAAASGRITVDG
ncbi:DUF2252 domain-containing protein [Herbiconiux ginsengi]|uniref:Uncharacterized conserved protein, DUF2252 family n=1 Tax=Herbiconiux ginsengi TaxID=381665 RepID=A0A1H3PIG3_9MICO|nr:DUF2252 domain-containing protein [Herbiconiux ginsengi]SDZ00645.1 Uncharacterized conserved protein, DUF2252 family [Herbiconiux ginsengi]